jgi:hypothetical protein
MPCNRRVLRVRAPGHMLLIVILKPCTQSGCRHHLLRCGRKPICLACTFIVGTREDVGVLGTSLQAAALVQRVLTYNVTVADLHVPLHVLPLPFVSRHWRGQWRVDLDILHTVIRWSASHYVPQLLHATVH